MRFVCVSGIEIDTRYKMIDSNITIIMMIIYEIKRLYGFLSPRNGE